MTILNFFVSVLFAYIASLGFTFVFHIRGKLLFIAPVGGVIIWIVYLLLEPILPGEIIRSFFATMAAALFCEVTARIMKVPVTVFMIIAIVPLVPGSGLYYTMEYAIEENFDMFMSKCATTIGIAGAIAVGMIFIASLFKIGTMISQKIKISSFKHNYEKL